MRRKIVRRSFLVILMLSLVLAVASRQETPIPQKPLTVWDFANAYASAVSSFDFKTASAMGSTYNRLILQGRIKPGFDRLEKQSGTRSFGFRTFEFERAYLIRDLDHLQVIMKLPFERPIQGKDSIYLRYEIKKVNRRYVVLNTWLDATKVF